MDMLSISPSDERDAADRALDEQPAQRRVCPIWCAHTPNHRYEAADVDEVLHGRGPARLERFHSSSASGSCSVSQLEQYVDGVVTLLPAQIDYWADESTVDADAAVRYASEVLAASDLLRAIQKAG